MAKAKKPEKERAEMTIADLGALIQANDKSLRALIANLDAKIDAKIEESGNEIMAVVARNFERVDGRFDQVDARFAEIDERFQQIEDRFQSVEMKILGTNNRIDMLIDRTRSREEFRRLEGRVAVLESRRKR